MIVQLLIEFLQDVVIGLISQLADPPTALVDAVSAVTNAGVGLSAYLPKLGVIVPWSTMGTIIGWWLSVWAFWLSVQLIRLILWIVGR